MRPRTALVAAALLALVASPFLGAGEPVEEVTFDVVIRGGTVYDGSG